MKRRAEGFTLVEVMIALGIMTIGALALVGMQQQTTRANVRARDMTTAMQIAQNVVERLKLDAIAWNNVTTAPANDLINSPMLQTINTTPNAFTTLAPVSSTLGGTTVVLSNAFDFLGNDLTLAGASTAVQNQVYFCASYRLSWVYVTFRAMRADVRVWWSKEVPTRSIITDFANCADNGVDLNPGGARFDDYHVVYLSTVLRPS
ncbi:MAG: prepilin-type N-terminal cleavage/methylation domain-containing protein [Polyangiales bacterium]